MYAWVQQSENTTRYYTTVLNTASASKTARLDIRPIAVLLILGSNRHHLEFAVGVCLACPLFLLQPLCGKCNPFLFARVVGSTKAALAQAARCQGNGGPARLLEDMSLSFPEYIFYENSTWYIVSYMKKHIYTYSSRALYTCPCPVLRFVADFFPVTIMPGKISKHGLGGGSQAFL